MAGLDEGHDVCASDNIGSERGCPSMVGMNDTEFDVTDLVYGFSNCPLTNCLFVNRTYQDMIVKTIKELDVLLMSNRERQREIRIELDDFGKRKMASSGRFAKTVAIPYFRDANGMAPPPNEDVTLKAFRNELPNRIPYPRRWSAKDQSLLVSAVERSAYELRSQRLLARKSILEAELRGEEIKKLPAYAVTAKRKEIEEKERGLQLLGEQRRSSLIGPRDQDYDWLKISAVTFNGIRSARNCEMFWKNFLHPSINKCPWSKDEKENLQRLAAVYGKRNWDTIAERLETGRTAFQCAEQYFSTENRGRKWTVEENQDLLNAIEVCRIGNYIPWHQVCYMIERRTPSMVRTHWMSNLNPSIRKGRWTEEEDILLLTGVFLYGPRLWFKVKDYVKDRTAAQCCERWKNTLDPSINVSEFSAEEDDKLKKLVQIHNKKWSIVADALGRTDNRCLSRWKVLCKPKVDIGEQPVSLPRLKLVDYRTNLYKNFIDRIIEVRDGNDTGSSMQLVISRTQLMQSFRRLSCKDYVKSAGEMRLGEFLRQRNIVALTEDMKLRPKPVKACMKPIDRALNEFFLLTSTRKNPGRPPKIRTAEVDDPIYREAVDEFRKLLLQCKAGQIAPLLPAMTITMQAFRNMLMMRRRLVRKREIPVQSAKRPKLDLQQQEEEIDDEEQPASVPASEEKMGAGFVADDAYGRLLTRFITLFSWPAILSATMPNSEPLKPPRNTAKKGRRRKNVSKKAKDDEFKCSVNTVTGSDDTVAAPALRRSTRSRKEN